MCYFFCSIWRINVHSNVAWHAWSLAQFEAGYFMPPPLGVWALSFRSIYLVPVKHITRNLYTRSVTMKNFTRLLISDFKTFFRTGDMLHLTLATNERGVIRVHILPFWFQSFFFAACVSFWGYIWYIWIKLFCNYHFHVFYCYLCHIFL